MTTFHDILGTDKKHSQADIKRRYKLLSSRCHPDKGGSKALMQLIGQSYEQVNAGKGHEEAVRTIFVKDSAADGYKIALHQLEQELQALKQINESLNQQLSEEQAKSQQFAEASQRKFEVEDLEEELLRVRRENRRLKKQLEEARWELSNKVRAVTTTTQEEDSPSSFQSSSSPNEISPKVFKQIKALGYFNVRKLGLTLMLPVLVVGLVLSLGTEPWFALLAMLDEPRKKPEAVVTILDSNPADNVQSQDEPELHADRSVPEKPKPVPRIQLANVAGVWQLRHFENTENPYISVRSDKGSYIVKSCQGNFQYYRNSNLRSTRLSANLIFDKQERHFLIYNIPYGNGSFAANWAESKSLLINKEYFPNKGFSDAYYELQIACSI
ncbi:J domain-containing protein [Photobacterium sp. SDRW27]|uniref:J domain-containing protein n=1 Tax=Photobacterium obscurum TaxID=2829490 RepID=UPI002243F185|nr:J domain-containing protein [Photobacterium obscurum]MCW8329835.1 J domain-containing protein [Photobacterium obscurum]